MNIQLALIALVILLLGFFSSDFAKNNEVTGTVVGQNIDISDASCKWNGQAYEVCMNVDWSGVIGSHAKAYITGGQSLDLTPKQYEKSFAYCDDAGDRDGTYGGGVYIYDTHQRVVAVNNKAQVSCNREKEVSENVFTKSFNFQAWKTEGFKHGSGNKGEGVVSIDLSREPESCELEGRWKTDNKKYKTLGRPQLYCHNAEGTTYGHVDSTGQYVINDANLFRWAGGSEPASDPLPEKTNDYILHLWTCDFLYYAPMDKRYYARAYVENFGSKNLELHWEYFNDDTLPAVDFFLDLTCNLKPEYKPVSKKVVIKEPVPEQPREAEETFDIDVEDLETEAVLYNAEPAGFWGKMKNWLVRLFF